MLYYGKLETKTIKSTNMKTMKPYPFYTAKRFCMTRMFAIPVAIASFCSFAPSQAQGQTTIIQNFDGYANSAALNADISLPTANATITLGTSDGVGGSQALNFQGANGSSPYYSQFTFDVTPFSLTGLADVTVQTEFLGGSDEYLQVQLLDSTHTTIATGPNVLTQTIPSASFSTYTIPFSGLNNTIDYIRFTYVSSDYGTTTCAFDNIATVAVPEPSSFALAGLGLAAFLLRRRQK